MKIIKYKAFVTSFLISCLVILLSQVAIAGDSKSSDKELLEKQSGFERFAVLKLQQLNRNQKYAPSRMEVIKQPDGTYLARYHVIDESSMSVQVRRSKSKNIPYVGILSYRENVYEMSAQSRDSFDQDAFKVVEIIPNRHIFSYKQGQWN